MRGDIYRLSADRQARGHEQQGPRFAVVVQSNDLRTSTALVAPTSRSARPATYRVEIEVDGTETQVMVEQIAAVDVERLVEHVGRVSSAEMAEIDDAMRVVFELW